MPTDVLLARAAGGGEGMIALDALPRWLSSETRETPRVDAPAWSHAPAEDPQA